MTSRRLGTVLLAAGICASVPAPASAASWPQLVAHDGYTGQGTGAGPMPPDSIAAVLYAARLGARAVKFDERWSRDNVPVVVHDLTADGTGWRRRDGTVVRDTGLIRDYSAARLESLHLLTLGGAWTPYHLASVAAMLRAVEAAGYTAAVIEIKTPVITAAQARSLYLTVTRQGALPITSVQTFFPQNVPVLRAAWPGVRIALLEARQVTLALPAGVSSVVLQGRLVTRPAVAALKAEVPLAGAYTSGGSGVPDGPAAWAAERSAGIGQVFTNNTAGYLRWAR